MNEIAGFGARREFALRPPADLADAREHVGDCLLLAMMMDAGTGSGLDLKQSSPHGRLNAKLGRDCGKAHRTCRLRGPEVESGWAYDVDWRISIYREHEWFLGGLASC